MTGQIRLSMQRGIAQGLSFFQWWKEQNTEASDKAFKDRMQIEYESLEETYSKDLNRIKEVVVTDSWGIPKEKWQIIIFTSPELAAIHGRTEYGKGRFQIIPYSTFKNSPTFRTIRARIAFRNKHNRYKTK